VRGVCVCVRACVRVCGGDMRVCVRVCGERVGAGCVLVCVCV